MRSNVAEHQDWQVWNKEDISGERGGYPDGLNGACSPKQRRGKGGGGIFPASGDAQACLKCAKGRPYKDINSQKTSRDRAEQERMKRFDDGGEQETMTGGKNPLGTKRYRAHGRGRRRGKWFEKLQRKESNQEGGIHRGWKGRQWRCRKRKGGDQTGNDTTVTGTLGGDVGYNWDLLMCLANRYIGK